MVQTNPKYVLTLFSRYFCKSGRRPGRENVLIRVALVENDSVLARELASFFARFEKEHEKGFEVRNYVSGRGFLAGGACNCDIAVIDAQLNGDDGFEVAAEMRTRGGEPL